MATMLLGRHKLQMSIENVVSDDNVFFRQTVADKVIAQCLSAVPNFFPPLAL